MQPVQNQELFEAIKLLGIVDETKLHDALAEATKTNHSLSQILVERDILSDENVGKTIADLISIPLVRLSSTSIDQAVLKIVPEIVAKKNYLIVFAKDQEGLKVAMANPHNKEVIAFLSKKTGEQIKAYYATSKDIENAFNLYKKELQASFDELFKKEIDKAAKESGEQPIARIFDLLIEYAYDNKASDIHIEPSETSSTVRFRIDGILHEVLILPKSLHDQVITRIKVLARLRTDEHLGAQDGKLQVNLTDEELDVRVSIVPIIEGEKVVLRLLSSKSRQFSLPDLGMSQADLEKTRRDPFF